MRLVVPLLAVLTVSATLTQAHAESASEYRHRLAKANGEMKIHEHEINMERKAGKITRDQAIADMKSTIEKDKEAHKMQ